MGKKRIIVIEAEPGRTFDELGCPGGRVMRSATGPPLSVFTSPGAVDDCKAMVDGRGAVAGWLHGTDCLISRSIAAAMAAELPKGSPIELRCARRAAGGAFEKMQVPG